MPRNNKKKNSSKKSLQQQSRQQQQQEAESSSHTTTTATTPQNSQQEKGHSHNGHPRITSQKNNKASKMGSQASKAKHDKSSNDENDSTASMPSSCRLSDHHDECDNNNNVEITDPPSVIISSTSGEHFGDGEETQGSDDTSIFDDGEYNAGMYRGYRGRRYCLSTLRFFGIFAFLWLCQYLFMTSMRHMGYISMEGYGMIGSGDLPFNYGETMMRFGNFTDFDPSTMAQRVLPQLQENWMSMFNESKNLANTYYTRQSQRPGYQLAQMGATVNYPVVMIPGFVTSGLEVWTSRECAKKYFRQRIWTGLESARALFTDKHCWREHVALDPHTGMDPEGIRLRASEGFEAADYFMANYWVWEKLLENLADLGYSPSTMSIEPYDWRMAFPLLEERDGYMTKLMYKIEAMHKSSGKKVVLTSHSMGAQLVHFFFKWVTTPQKDGGGGGGKKWVDEHIHAYVNIAGSHLGVTKAASALLSGEMRDFAIIGTIGAMAEQFFGRKLRKDLWNTWPSLWGMLPKGGDRIWDIGADVCNMTNPDPEDPFCQHFADDSSTSPTSDTEKRDGKTIPLLFLKADEEEGEASDDDGDCDTDAANPTLCQNETIFDIPHDDSTMNAAISAFARGKQHSTGEVFDFLRDYGAGLGSDLASSKLYDNYGDMKAKQRNKPKVEWLDTTITPLPYAPNLNIYCMYGVGLDTERAYFYKVNNDGTPGMTDIENKSQHPPKPNPELPVVLDMTVDDPQRKTKTGIRFSDGDGSVPLVSLGYICNDAWTRKDSGLNPSGTKVVTREYLNRNEFVADDPFRGGPRSADHVDILGNVDMTEDFLRVVSGFKPPTESHIVSNLQEISKVINEHPKGGIFKKKKRLFGL